MKTPNAHHSLRHLVLFLAAASWLPLACKSAEEPASAPAPAPAAAAPVRVPEALPVVPDDPPIPLPTGTWDELSNQFAEGDCPSYLPEVRRRMVRARKNSATETVLVNEAALWLQACERDRRRLAAAPPALAGMDAAGLEERYLERGAGTPEQLRGRLEGWRAEAGADVDGYRKFLLLQVLALRD